MLHNETVCQVGTLLTLLNSTLAKVAAANAPGGDTGAAVAMERVFLFCLAWSIGGLLDSKDRDLFDAELRTMTSALPKKVRRPAYRAQPAYPRYFTVASPLHLHRQLACPAWAITPWCLCIQACSRLFPQQLTSMVNAVGVPRRLRRATQCMSTW